MTYAFAAQQKEKKAEKEDGPWENGGVDFFQLLRKRKLTASEK